jgi:hypothetical protein
VNSENRSVNFMQNVPPSFCHSNNSKEVEDKDLEEEEEEEEEDDIYDETELNDGKLI